MRGDGRRTLLVIGEQADLFLALREALDSPMLQVAWSDPASVSERAMSCLPWPWAICGGGSGPAPGSLARLRRRPVLRFWLGEPPAEVGPARSHPGWRSLLDDIRSHLSTAAFGLALAPNRGVIGPAGLLLSADLEGLLAASPEPVDLSARSAAAVARLLARLELPVGVAREEGRARLVPAR